jgi:hypothetical protein
MAAFHVYYPMLMAERGIAGDFQVEADAGEE